MINLYTTQPTRANSASGVNAITKLGIRPWSFPPAYTIRGVGNLASPVAIQPTDAFRGLSNAERNVCVWVVCGLPNKEVARRLGITEATVKVHMKGAMRKLGIQNRTALVAIMRPQGTVGHPVDDLTADEAGILRLIYEAKTFEEIADELGMGTSLLKSKVRTCCKKIGVEGRVDAARWWLNHRGSH